MWNPAHIAGNSFLLSDSLEDDIMLQFDQSVRVVSIRNLRAMCARVSGHCHTFIADDPARYMTPAGSVLSVRVEYSNPTEYGNPEPIATIYPIAYIFGPDDPAVILQGIAWQDDYINPDDVGLDGMFQAFDALEACPHLFASSPHSDDWMTREEWEAERAIA
jgi:hypothetical protein